MTDRLIVRTVNASATSTLKKDKDVVNQLIADAVGRCDDARLKDSLFALGHPMVKITVEQWVSDLDPLAGEDE